MRYSFLLFVALSWMPAQTPPARSSGLGPDPVKVANLLETGQCPGGLPLALKAYARAADTGLKRRTGSAGVRCAMSMNNTSMAADLIATLTRDFPRDPDILYLAVHTYSD